MGGEMSIIEIFQEHPKSIGETYWEHMKFALSTAIKLQVAVISLAIHSVFPFLFTDFASKSLYSVVDDIELRAQKRK